MPQFNTSGVMVRGAGDADPLEVSIPTQILQTSRTVAAGYQAAVLADNEMSCHADFIVKGELAILGVMYVG